MSPLCREMRFHDQVKCRMKNILPVVVLLAGLLPADAAVIQTSAFCQAGPIQQTSTYACDEQSGHPLGEYFAAGAAAVAEYMTPTGSYTYGAYGYAGASAAAYNTADSASGEAHASFRETFGTVGPVRSGWIDLSIRVDYDFAGDADLTAHVLASVAGYSSSGKYPILLGQPFLIDLDLMAGALAQGHGPEFRISGGVSRYLWMQFALYESDGVTPVFTPEPVGLGIAGLLALLLARAVRVRTET